MRQHIDAILQIGDLPYLQHYLGTLGYKNLHNRHAKRLMPDEKDSLLEMLCRKGHVDMLKFVQQNNLVVNPAAYQNSSGLNCMHLAVQKNQPDMIKYLLDTYPDLAERKDSVKEETPLFYTLSKHQSNSTRLSLAQLFVDHNERALAAEKSKKAKPVDLQKKNIDGKTVYEAYSADAIAQAAQSDTDSADKCTGTALDEAAAIIERQARIQSQLA